jgi:hypothetical protein
MLPDQGAAMPKATFKQVTITRTVKGVQAAGLPVERVEVAPDGTVIVIMNGSGAPKAGANDWDRQ